MSTRYLIALGICLLWLLPLAAQPISYQWKDASSGGYTYRYVSNDPMQVRFYTLKNGLKVIVSVNKKQPRIQTLFAVRAGSNTDPRNFTGLAHYLEHMLFKGTDKYGSLDWQKEKPLLDKIDSLYEVYGKTTDSLKRGELYSVIDKTSNQAARFAIANEYDKMMASMGAQGTNAHTWVEETVYEEDIPSNALDRYLSVQAERFRNPILRIFHTELEAVYEEKNRSLDSDPNKVFEAMLEGLFPTHNYGQQTTIGTVEHLKNPSLKEIRNYYYTYYVPNNMAIILAGDLNPDEVVKKIEEKFSYMQPKEVPQYKPNPEAPLPAPVVKEVFGPNPENISIAFRIPGRVDNQATLVSTVLDEIMSNSKAGLIDLNLNKAQKILNGGSTIIQFKDYAVWDLFATPKAGQSLDEVKALLLEQLDKIRKGDFDESLVKAIVNNYKLNAIQNLEHNDSRAYELMQSFIQSKGENWAEEAAQLDDMSKVTKAQIMDFANKYYLNNYCIVYKRTGQDAKIRKVPKPKISPVDLNRDAQSEFVKTTNNIPLAATAPVWLDFKQNIQRAKLGNAEVLYVPNTDNKLFRVYYRLEMGSWNNKFLPLAAQYLNFLGTDKYTTEQISREFFNLAGNFSVNIGNEVSTVSISGLEENMEKTLSLFEELIYNCKPDQNALQQLKDRILKSRSDSKKRKENLLRGLNSYAQYGPKNPFNNQLSNEELEKLTAQQLLDLLHSLLSYQHQIIGYTPLNLNDFTAKLKPIHKVPAKFLPYPAKSPFVKVSQTDNQVLFADFDMVQSEIQWVRNTNVYDPKQAPVVELFNNYFGGGMSSIVFQTIRESKALAYATYAFYSTPARKNEPYTLVGYVGSQADKFHEAVSSMNELLNTLPEAAENLETARKNLKKTLETERITGDGIIFSYLSALDHGIDYDERKLVYENIDKLSVADLKKFSQTYLSGKPYTLCVVASEKNLKPEDFQRYGSFKKLSLQEIFGY
jgi:predicted Zn-dependent peptidase